MRYSYEFKIKCVEMYERGEYPDTPDGVSYSRFIRNIRIWKRMVDSSGLVGKLMIWQTMSSHTAHSVLLIEILLLHFILPTIISYGVYYYMEKKGFVKDEDYKLDL